MRWLPLCLRAEVSALVNVNVNVSRSRAVHSSSHSRLPHWLVCACCSSLCFIPMCTQLDREVILPALASLASLAQWLAGLHAWKQDGRKAATRVCCAAWPDQLAPSDCSQQLLQEPGAWNSGERLQPIKWREYGGQCTEYGGATRGCASSEPSSGVGASPC